MAEEDASLDRLLDNAESLVDEKTQKDAKDEDEEREARRQERQHGFDLKEEELRARQDERNLRRSYANRVFGFLITYCAFVGFCILAQGFKFGGFGLDRYVLAALVGSTSISAIGVVSSVVRGLFLLNSNRASAFSDKTGSQISNR